MMSYLKAKDADQFVRVWLRDDTMLFTGSIRHDEDTRYELTSKVTN